MQLGHTGPFSFVRRISFICDLHLLECKLLLPADDPAPDRKPQNQIDFVCSSQDMSPLSWQLNSTQLDWAGLAWTEGRRFWRQFSLRIWSTAHMALRIRPVVAGPGGQLSWQHCLDTGHGMYACKHNQYLQIQECIVGQDWDLVEKE